MRHIKFIICVFRLVLVTPTVNSNLENNSLGLEHTNSSHSDYLVGTYNGNSSLVIESAMGSDVVVPGHSDLTTRTPTEQLSLSFTTIHDVVIERANALQFQKFLPSFVFICILLMIGIPGNIIALNVYIRLTKKAIARKFIIMMASSDLITCLVAMPIELSFMTQYFTCNRPVLCKSFRFTSYLVNNISSLTLLVIAVERYRMICTPRKKNFTDNFSRTICYITVAFSALTAVPMVFMYGTQTIALKRFTIHNGTVEAYHNTNIVKKANTTTANVTDKSEITVYGKSCLIDDKMIASSFPFYVISIYIASVVMISIALMYLYGHVVLSLSKRRKESLTQQGELTQRAAAQRVRSITLMAITLTALYGICYLPCLIIVSIRMANPTLGFGGEEFYQISLKLYLVNSALNPFIYCFYNRDFRKQICAGVIKKINKNEQVADIANVNGVVENSPASREQ